MVVKTLGNGREVSGLYIGDQNARRHFPRDQKHIELLLGHLHIHCDLPPEFWNGRPEITDSRLGAWLFSRFFHGKTSGAPVSIEMVPAGDDAFRLLPLSKPAVSTNGPVAVRHEHRETQTPRKRRPVASQHNQL